MDVLEDDEEFERQNDNLEAAVRAESGGWDKKEAQEEPEEKKETEYSTKPIYEKTPGEDYILPENEEED